MRYPCAMIRDLIPLYIDEACSEESRAAVDSHIEQCDECGKLLMRMRQGDNLGGNASASEDMKAADSLKKIKKRISRKVKTAIVTAIAAVLAVIAGAHLLYQVPVKDVPIEEVSISAKVYSLAEMVTESAEGTKGDETVKISADEDDRSGTVCVNIPELGELELTEEMMEKYKHLSVISITSDYFLRTIQKQTKDGTIYITAVKTTVLNNKAGAFQKQLLTVEFSSVERIVYLNEDGEETLLWSK